MKGPEILLIFVALCAASCSPRLLPTTTQTKDSVRVEYRERLVRDTAYVEIPREVERIITRDTTSRLENSYALSTAAVQSGELHHTLETKPQRIAAPVLVPVRDTIIIRETSEAQTIVQYRDRELTAGQKRQIAGFWILLVAGILLVAWKIYKAFRP